MDNYMGLSPEQASERLLRGVSVILETETVPLEEALGRVAAEAVNAPFPLPPFDRSAMDGYALRAADTLNAAAENPAALSFALPIGTGGALPEGCDAVAKREDTEQRDGRVFLRRALRPGENVCFAGEDIAENAPVLEPGRLLGRGELGLLAALGVDTVTVRRRPRAVLLTTGSELLAPGEAPRPGAVYDSLSPMLTASLRAAGIELLRRERCGDDAEGLKTALRRAAEDADLVLTTGGVSVGDSDLLPDVLDALGAELCFRRVRIKPGSPTTAAFLGGTPILCLPGTPFAAAANFDYYFYPLLARLLGCPALLPQTAEAAATSDFARTSPVLRLLRAKEENGRVFIPADQRPSDIAVLADCNCYVEQEPEQAVRTGDRVHIRRMKVT